MRYNISGADRETGGDINICIEARDEVSARDIAHKKGILVSQVEQDAPVRRPPAHSRPIPLEHGHVAGAPIVNVAIPRRGSSLGVAAIVLGIVAFLICWIPVVNVLSILLGGLGLALGVVGLFVASGRRGSGVGLPIAGSALCLLALVVSIGMYVVVLGGASAIADAAQRADARLPVSPPAGPGPARATPAPAAKPAVDWIPADQIIRQGDTRLRILSVRVEKIPLKALGGDDSTSNDELLKIVAEVTNLSETKKADYHTFRGGEIVTGDVASLADNFENRYKRINFGFGTKIVGAVDRESLYPGKSITDVMVFERPIANAQYLRLTLPASAFGGTGSVKLEIPASMIQP